MQIQIINIDFMNVLRWIDLVVVLMFIVIVIFVVCWIDICGGNNLLKEWVYWQCSCDIDLFFGFCLSFISFYVLIFGRSSLL